jgi:hypothetical protein
MMIQNPKLYSICLLLFFVESLAVLSVDRIESCMLEAVQKMKDFSSKKSAEMFHLHFGDPAVEIFNVINPADIKRIKILNKCVQIEDASLFKDTT